MKHSALGFTLLVSTMGIAHADVNPQSQLSVTTNIYASSCVAARNALPLSNAINIARSTARGIPADRTEYFVRKGYEFAEQYPNIHCNQIYITVIDTLVGDEK